MKNIKILALIITLVMTLALSSCSAKPTESETIPPPVKSIQDEFSQEERAVNEEESAGQIFLYGEVHGKKAVLDKEFELWGEHYRNDGMRHLFIEVPYYTAEFMNLWMQADDDTILEEIFLDAVGTASNTPDNKAFFMKIKNEYPETIFHGTDVGHQYDTTGQRYLDYLETNDLKDSEQYLLVEENIEQGKQYYENEDNIDRENKMAENFIREFDELNGESIMGIYGIAHTGLDGMDYYTRSVPSMANQLSERYGDAVYSEDISWLKADMEPIRTDRIIVGEKEYEASYFGREELDWHDDYEYREFWRLENAYDDFKESSGSGDNLPNNNYPMLIETGQVFVIDYVTPDGSVDRTYYLSNGNTWEGMQTTEGFNVD